MAVKPKEPKTQMICAVCNEEFTGKKCPQCGNAKDNIELSNEGIPKHDYAQSAALGSVTSLRPTDVALNMEHEMAQQIAVNQQQELQDNLRETFLIKSELKRMELEEKLNQRREQNAPLRPPQQQPPQPDPFQAQVPNPFTQPQMSPQALFMNKFMNLDAEDRTEFLNQLAEADPAALSTLSGFFAQAQSQMPQQQMMNPYMQQQMNPYMQMPPPWMQQPQYERSVTAEDPTTVALTIVDKLQDMSARGRQGGSSEETQIINLLREDLRAVNERLSTMSQASRNVENEAILMELGELRAQMAQPRGDNSLKSQIHSIKEMVTDLQEIGMMQKPESKNSVDEQIRLSEAHHNIQKEDREIELKELSLKAEEAKTAMNKSLVSGLFGRQLQKSLHASDEAQSCAIPQRANISTGPMNSVVYQQSKPDVVLGETITDAGVIRETRVPVQKDAEE